MSGIDSVRVFIVNTTADPEFFDPAALADRWGTSVSSIRRAIATRRLPAVKPLGRVRIPASAVHEAERVATATMDQPLGATMATDSPQFI